ncbi:6851_t:CDS:2, partial [Paraglomus brasilianum]
VPYHRKTNDWILVAIDPGVRTPFVTYSPEEIGKNDAWRLGLQRKMARLRESFERSGIGASHLVLVTLCIPAAAETQGRGNRRDGNHPGPAAIVGTYGRRDRDVNRSFLRALLDGAIHMWM